MMRNSKLSHKDQENQGCPLLPLLFNIILDIIAYAVKTRKLKKKKRYTDWEWKNKAVFVHRWHGCLCRKSKNQQKTPGTNE